MNLIIGSHVSFTSKTQLLGSVNEALKYGANTFMMYTGSTQSTQRSKIDMDITNKAKELMIKNNIDINNVIVHAPYIINFANRSSEEKYNFYIDFFCQELNRCNTLGLNKIVLHPGSATSCSRQEGLNNIINALNIVIDSTKDVKILLEYMSGKGNELGISIDELKVLIDGIENKDRIGICLDTCHMHDSGVDLSKYDEFLDEFDNKIGLDKIKCIHINDSKNDIESHKDRHENIGYGKVGFNNLLNVIYNKRLNVPYILETPYINRNSKDAIAPYKEEIEMIKNKKFVDFIQ